MTMTRLERLAAARKATADAPVAAVRMNVTLTGIPAVGPTPEPGREEPFLLVRRLVRGADGAAAGWEAALAASVPVDWAEAERAISAAEQARDAARWRGGEP